MFRDAASNTGTELQYNVMTIPLYSAFKKPLLTSPSSEYTIATEAIAMDGAARTDGVPHLLEVCLLTALQRVEELDARPALFL